MQWKNFFSPLYFREIKRLLIPDYSFIRWLAVFSLIKIFIEFSYIRPILFNYRSRSISQCAAIGSSAVTNPYTSLGLLGTNQIGAIADTGLDVTSCYFSDPYSKVTFSTINNPIYNKSARKVIQYASVPLYSDNFDVVNGHGTHTVGTMVGSVTSSNADYATSKLFCVVLCCVVLCCVVLCCIVLCCWERSSEGWSGWNIYDFIHRKRFCS